MVPTSSEWYEFADERMEYLRKYANAEYQNTSNRLARFDELNVVTVRKTATALYNRLSKKHRKLCEDVAETSYRMATLVAEEKGYKRTKKFSGAAKLVTMLFTAFDPVTKYQFMNETERKRDRMIEQIMSAKGRQQVIEAHRIAAKNWFRQAQWATDQVVDASMLEAYEDHGVEKVRWVSQGDSKVCKQCRQRDGNIYSIGSIPSKPHPRCRCIIVPVDYESKA